ncbi:uncharacterized protein MYCFIDRAFT_178954 [Pseudocercospora fijiensis CIRAD86]|uniref:Uncharacterized protein n=1 Tax=Pseudocercospora fijiensis (strain CIRAD86) TaxID=383855 RepID=M3A2X7_PSEFD|nr:uncharacterized protein MYCFIDRAFT_178954 [Pseudocercospora fijiensis CIRAD86]EME78861.1 hypothetical protein MYCFIDRAFT_178954 [Pseudocercospora fijiensis CIRAD86]
MSPKRGCRQSTDSILINRSRGRNEITDDKLPQPPDREAGVVCDLIRLIYTPAPAAYGQKAKFATVVDAWWSFRDHLLCWERARMLELPLIPVYIEFEVQLLALIPRGMACMGGRVKMLGFAAPMLPPFRRPAL